MTEPDHFSNAMAREIDVLLRLISNDFIDRHDLPGKIAGMMIVLSLLEGISAVEIAEDFARAAENEEWDDLVPQIQEFWTTA